MSEPTVEQIAAQTVDSTFYCAANQAVLAREIIALRESNRETLTLVRSLTDAIVEDAQKIAALTEVVQVNAERVGEIRDEHVSDRTPLSSENRFVSDHEQVFGRWICEVCGAPERDGCICTWKKRANAARAILADVSKGVERERVEGNGWISCSWVRDVIGQQPEDDGEWMRGVG